MKEAASHRLQRIARSLCIDIVSERIAMSIAGLRPRFANDGPRDIEISEDGRYYDRSGRISLNGVEFEVSNATFIMWPNRSGAGVFFPNWRKGTLKHNGNTIYAEGARFGIADNTKHNGTWLSWQSGSIELGGTKVSLNKANYSLSNDMIFWSSDPSYINTAEGDYTKSPMNGVFSISGQTFSVKDARFTVHANSAGSGVELDWRQGTMGSTRPILAVGKFRNFTGSVAYGDAVINCSDATFELSHHIRSTIIDWRDGVWHDGVFTNGIWENGTWENGTWQFGYWRGGTWNGGYQMIPDEITIIDKNGVEKNVYSWNGNCRKIKRKTPPTGMFKPILMHDKNGNPYYDVDPDNTKGGEWTKDENGNALNPSLFPVEAIDLLNSRHMWGDTSHKGRNEFMKSIDNMRQDPFSPNLDVDIEDPKIYRIYYDHKDKINRNLYVLYKNGYLKIFKLNEITNQRLMGSHHVLAPASHRPASLRDLDMLAQCSIFKAFLPMPKGNDVVTFIPNDGKFPKSIFRKAHLVSKFQVFDPRHLDDLFYPLDTTTSTRNRNDAAIKKFKSEWKAALDEIEKMDDGENEELLADLEDSIDTVHGSLTAMEKMNQLLKDLAGNPYDQILSKRNNNFNAINTTDWSYIRSLNKITNGSLIEADLKNWAMTADPVPQKFIQSYDDIMEKLRTDVIKEQEIIKNIEI